MIMKEQQLFQLALKNLKLLTGINETACPCPD